ncbi:DUF3693 domain-containing protein [Xanthomonas citri]
MKAVHAKNDTELAKALGIKPAAVSNYRRGVSLPNAVVCATLAGLTGEPLAKVLGVVGEARAISSDEKAVWRRLAATAMTLALGMSLALPVRAEAAVKAFQDTPNYTLCEIGCWRSCAPWRPTNADPSTAADRTMTLVT